MVVTVNVPAVPTVKVVWSALVIAGGSFTVSVKVCVAFGGTPLLRGDGERVDAAGTRGRGAGQGRGAVTVVGEGHAGRQRAGLGERSRSGTRWWSP